MKLVFNTWPGAYFTRGGGEVQLEQSKKALEKRGHKVNLFDVWSPQREVDLYHQFSVEVGTHHVLNSYRERGAKIALAPIMWTMPPKDIFNFHYYRDLLLKADVVLTNSLAENKKIADWFELPPQKFFKVRNAIGGEYSTDGDGGDRFRHFYSVPDEFVLSVANIDQRKNTHRLLLAAKNMGVAVVAIGQIRDKDYFRSLQKMDNFFWLGPINDIEVLKSAYQSCLVFALPSLCETPGIAALEAVSQGAPLLITQEGPTEEYFGKSATYVDPLDQASIEKGLSAALKKTKNLEGQELIRSHCTWDLAAEDIELGYRFAFK